jgi:cytochrome P450
LLFWDGMKYTNGIMKETLRLVPPGSGLARFGEKDFSLAGYRIPKGLSVQLDPRIGNKDSSLFEQAESFEPLRWVPSGATTTPAKSSCPFKGTALSLGVGSWFPGGNGSHRCPGVPLAELVSTMFLAALSERFESWEFGGSGLTPEGAVNFVSIPIKIAPDDLGLKFTIRQK